MVSMMDILSGAAPLMVDVRQSGPAQANAARMARSGQEERGRLTCRHKTATSWRKTRISAFLDACAGVSSPSQPKSWQKISRGVWTSWRAMIAGLYSPKANATGQRHGPGFRHLQASSQAALALNWPESRREGRPTCPVVGQRAAARVTIGVWTARG